MSSEFVDHLLVKRLQGNLDDLEHHQLERWCAESAGNAGYAEQVAAFWELADRAVPVSPRPPATSVVRAAGRTGHRLLRWSAAVAAVIGIGFLADSVSRRDLTVPAQTDFVAGPQAPVTLSLEDGSV